jgi:hypothetical protein
MTASRAPRLRSGPILVFACSALIVGVFALRVSLLQTRTLDPDELQHLHAGWAVHEGLLPYRDFFEHHMPGLPFVLSWVQDGFDVNHDDAAAIQFVFVARALMLGLVAIVVALTFVIGRRVGGPPVGWLSAALLGTSIVFVGRTLEIRPDVPALPLWLLTTLALMRGVDPAGRTGRSRSMWAVAGLSLGCALALNQKLLLAAPGLLAVGVWHVLDANSSSSRTAKVLDLVAFAIACAIPLAGLVAFFWLHGATGDFVRGTITGNMGWPQEVSARSTLKWILLRDPLLSSLGVAGFIRSGMRLVSVHETRPADAVLLLPAASLLLGLTVIPAPFPQYMLLVLPAAAVVAAAWIWTGVAGLPAHGERGVGVATAAFWLSATACIIVAAIAIALARPFFLHAAVYPLLAATTLLVVVWLKARKKPAWAAAFFVLASSSYSLQQLRWMQGLSNAEQLRDMRFVHQSTAPTDRVLDGFSGLGWFRPQAVFHSFLHSGVRNRLSAGEVSEILATLQNCETRPKLVILDGDLLALSPAVAPTVAQFYQSTAAARVWIRRGTPAACGEGRAAPR